MSKLKFWQFIAMLGMIDQEKEKEVLRQNQDSKVNSVSRKMKHSKSLGQHRYVHLFNRSR